MSRTGHLLNTSVQLWRAVTADDGGGGQETTWQLQATVRARLSQPSARERQAADQSQASLTHVVYLKPSAGVLRGDELRRDGVVYEVNAVFQPSVSGTYLRADCTARQPTVES
ncbi:phage head closure protein [Streptomyces sp. NPDC057302]|uniref:phage head closure protein n=1 Tax=Streptomyces sp. NPDC057302 TaxID=3346094 RepID=UPI00362ED54C